jgi:ABC-type branched-subunit amino acid transport system permease subunit
VNRLKLLAFAFGAATAGLTGTLFAAVQIGVFPQNFDVPLLITIYAMVILGGTGSLTGVVLGAAFITIVLEVLRESGDARLVFYIAIVALVLGAIRPLWRGAAVVAGTVAFGYVVHAIGGAVSDRVTAGSALEGGSLGGAIESWVLLPRDAGDVGNYTFVALVVAAILVTRLQGVWRLVTVVPVLYLAAFVWENKLVTEPSVTRFLLLGALLVVLMNVRPQGLLGTARVEIV